jgi:hypothetical protein
MRRCSPSPLPLTRTHTHTHTHPHPHTHTHTNTVTHTHSPCLSPSLSPSRSLTLALTLSLALSHTLPHTLPHTDTHSHTHTPYTHTLSPSFLPLIHTNLRARSVVHPSSTPEFCRVPPSTLECRVRVQAWADALAGALRLTAEWAEAVVGASSDGSPRTQALRALSVDPQTHRDTHTHARTHRYAHRDTPARAPTLTLARTRPHTCACTHARTHRYAHTETRSHAHTHSRSHAHARTRAHARAHAGQPDAIGLAQIGTGPKRSLEDGSAVGLRVQRVGSRAARRGACAIDRPTPLPMRQARTAAPITTATVRRRCGGCSPSGTRARCAGGRKSPHPLRPQYSRTLNLCPYSSLFLEPRPPRNPGIPPRLRRAGGVRIGHCRCWRAECGRGTHCRCWRAECGRGTHCRCWRAECGRGTHCRCSRTASRRGPSGRRRASCASRSRRRCRAPLPQRPTLTP